ncbi:MAG: SIMPL domain-containing protein [Oscillospiraceae bacterium]|nr:SIMPL domain-containing protein [Oscillospiraceae bacterium]
MANTITVKGTGSVHVPPDTIEISFTLQAKAERYADTMQIAEKKRTALTAAVLEAGCGEDALKTADFRVNTDYEHLPDENGNYRPVFKGYVCVHSFRLELPVEMKLLAAVLGAAERSEAEPEFSVSFTVKDRFAVQEQVLREAAAQARRNAEILADASGVRLGTLCAVSYEDSRSQMVSQTRCNLLAAGKIAMATADMNIAPDDITVEETAVFVWEILS